MTHLQGVSDLGSRGRMIIKPRNHSQAIYDVFHIVYIICNLIIHPEEIMNVPHKAHCQILQSEPNPWLSPITAITRLLLGLSDHSNYNIVTMYTSTWCWSRSYIWRWSLLPKCGLWLTLALLCFWLRSGWQPRKWHLVICIQPIPVWTILTILYTYLNYYAVWDTRLHADR